MQQTFTLDDRDIKMTFGLLDELTRIIGDVDGLAEMPINADVRKEVLIAVLVERDEKGKRGKTEPDIYNLEADTVTEILEWVGEHVADFFLSAMERTKKLLEARTDRFKALQPSSTGGKD